MREREKWGFAECVQLPKHLCSSRFGSFIVTDDVRWNPAIVEPLGGFLAVWCSQDELLVSEICQTSSTEADELV